MKQPHTEQTIDHTEGEQNTGNHKVPGAPHVDGKGGTRAGAKNVEGGKDETAERGPDFDRVAGPDQPGSSSKHPNAPDERVAERDEHGRV